MPDIVDFFSLSKKRTFWENTDKASIRAGGARGLGQQGRAVYLLAWWQGKAGPAGQRHQLASLVITCFPHLSQSKKISLFVLTL